MPRSMTEETKKKIAYAKELHEQGFGFVAIRKKIKERFGSGLNNNLIAKITNPKLPGTLTQEEKAENVQLGKSKRNASARARAREASPDLRPAPGPAPANLIEHLRGAIPLTEEDGVEKVLIYKDAMGMHHARIFRTVVDDIPLGKLGLKTKGHLRVVGGA